MVRFADDQFSETYATTIDADFRFKTMIVNEKTTKMQIWATAGQERFRSITNAYYRGAEAILIVFDLTNRESFLYILDWIEEVSKYTWTNICKLVLANKCDLNIEREVSRDEIEEFEKKNGIKVIEVSAKSSTNVDHSFKTIVESLINKKEK